jgi:WXG100 family type VII secretion target
MKEVQRMGTLQMNTDDFRGTGTTVTSESQNFNEELTRFLAAADAMNGAWEGADKEAFDGIVAELKPLFQKAQENMSAVGADMTKTGNDGDATTESNVNLINSSL